MWISPEQEALIGSVFESYLTEHHHGDVLQLVAEASEDTHHPVVVNAMTLFEANMEVGDYFNAYPGDVLAIFDKVLHRKAAELSDEGGQRSKEQRMRHTLHARITGLPVCPELTRETIPRSRDVGHFLSVTGTVIRTSVAKVLEYERDYMCTKCHHVFNVQADFDQFYTFVPPVGCPSPDGCNSYKFSCLSGGAELAVCRDYQEIKIQEQVQRLSVGSIPRSIVVVLEDDLADSCKSGDDVTVYGVVCLRWKPLYDGTRCDVELVLKANNLEVNNQQAAADLLIKDAQKEFEDFWSSYRHDPIAGRNQVLLSLCPQVFGMYVVKLAVAMVLAGGVQRTDSSGTKIRGECHMLLVGDPGTGKSQFLKYAAKIVSRSVLTAGIGSTSAGLTVAAVKDGGDWHLEAGALVLSDGGLCCIDELNSIKEHDRISIHEAMEQQSISVAKAGMVCKLNTRATILAATNPKGQYDSNEPLSVNVALASPLLSRFDLVLVLLDTRNAEWDRIISSFILEDRGLPAEASSLWSMEKMKAYFSVIKRLKPQTSEEANCILTRYYQLQRRSDGRNAARTTIRMLESLSRLAEAHARLMYRETVTIEDAVIAVSVMECSMQGGALLGSVNALLTSFPTDPDQQYRTQCQMMLEGLDLPLLLQQEMDRLSRLRRLTSGPADPPPGTHQPQLSVTDSSNRTQSHGVGATSNSGVTAESGLTRVHAITPSLSPGGMTLSIIASTQENLNWKPNSSWSDMSPVPKQPSCQPEKDVQRNTVAPLNHRTAESAEEHRCKPQEELQSERPPEETLSGPPGRVLRKVSEYVRDKTFRQLELHQQCDPEGGGHGQRVVSADGAHGLDPASESQTSSTVSDETRPSYVLVQDNLSADKEGRSEKDGERGLTGSKAISAVLREKMAAEAGTDLHAKLSGFMFKPRKMRPPVHNHEVTTSSEEQKPRRRDTQKPVSQADSASPPPNTRQKKQKLHGVSDGGGRAGGSEATAGFTAKELDGEDLSFKEDTAVGREEARDDPGSLCQQRSSVNMAAQAEASTSTNSPAPFQSGWPAVASSALASSALASSALASSALASSALASSAVASSAVASSAVASSAVASSALASSALASSAVASSAVASSAVASSALASSALASSALASSALASSALASSAFASSAAAKLSRFSFTCTAAPTTPQTNAGKAPPKRGGAESLGAGSDSPSHGASAKKSRLTDSVGRMKDALPSAATELSPGRDHEQQTELPRAAGPAARHSTVNLKRRKCFELDPPPSRDGARGLFSGLSLFGSAELSNDVLDTDWDQEVVKKAKG